MDPEDQRDNGAPTNPTSPDAYARVRSYYDSAVEQEWRRLDRHRTEFSVTLRAIQDGLASLAAPGDRSAEYDSRDGACRRILDIGGGPGRYSQALHQLGHEVTLLDLSPANVEYARRLTGGALAGYHAGSATDLRAFADASFDVALLFGPLYHLLDEIDRRRAVSEALRVLRPGGLLFTAFITVFAPLRDLAKWNPAEITKRMPTPEATLAWVRDGRAPWAAEAGFTEVWFVHPDAVVPFMEQATGGALETLSLLSAEGIVSMIEDKVNELEGPLWDYWVELNYRLASEPSILGAAEHLVHVGRRRR